MAPLKTRHCVLWADEGTRRWSASVRVDQSVRAWYVEDVFIYPVFARRGLGSLRLACMRNDYRYPSVDVIYPTFALPPQTLPARQ